MSLHNCKHFWNWYPVSFIILWEFHSHFSNSRISFTLHYAKKLLQQQYCSSAHSTPQFLHPIYLSKLSTCIPLLSFRGDETSFSTLECSLLQILKQSWHFLNNLCHSINCLLQRNCHLMSSPRKAATSYTIFLPPQWITVQILHSATISLHYLSCCHRPSLTLPTLYAASLVWRAA